MARFKFAAPLTTALLLWTPVYTTAYGVESKRYEVGELIHGNIRSFGGTDRDVNGVYSVEKTATIETWYRPDITSNCRIQVVATGEMYEILGAPENIEMRNQYLRIKVRLIEGGA